jgi:hypothetical protein
MRRACAGVVRSRKALSSSCVRRTDMRAPSLGSCAEGKCCHAVACRTGSMTPCWGHALQESAAKQLHAGLACAGLCWGHVL